MSTHSLTDLKESAVNKNRPSLSLVETQEEQIAYLRRQLQRSEEEKNEIMGELLEKQQELDALTHRFGWKILTFYGQIKDTFLPHQSPQRKLYDKVLAKLK